MGPCKFVAEGNPTDPRGQSTDDVFYHHNDRVVSSRRLWRYETHSHAAKGIFCFHVEHAADQPVIEAAGISPMGVRSRPLGCDLSEANDDPISEPPDVWIRTW